MGKKKLLQIPQSNKFILFTIFRLKIFNQAKKKEMEVEATHDYVGEINRKQLTFNKGDKIIILDKFDNGWGTGAVVGDKDGIEGYFPINHVKLPQALENSLSSPIGKLGDDEEDDPRYLIYEEDFLASNDFSESLQNKTYKLTQYQIEKRSTPTPTKLYHWNNFVTTVANISGGSAEVNIYNLSTSKTNSVTPVHSFTTTSTIHVFARNIIGFVVIEDKQTEVKVLNCETLVTVCVLKSGKHFQGTVSCLEMSWDCNFIIIGTKTGTVTILQLSSDEPETFGEVQVTEKNATIEAFCLYDDVLAFSTKQNANSTTNNNILVRLIDMSSGSTKLSVSGVSSGDSAKRLFWDGTYLILAEKNSNLILIWQIEEDDQGSFSASFLSKINGSSAFDKEHNTWRPGEITRECVNNKTLISFNKTEVAHWDLTDEEGLNSGEPVMNMLESHQSDRVVEQVVRLSPCTLSVVLQSVKGIDRISFWDNESKSKICELTLKDEIGTALSKRVSFDGDSVLIWREENKKRSDYKSELVLIDFS